MNKYAYIYIYGITDGIIAYMFLCILLAFNSFVCYWVNVCIDVISICVDIENI